MTAKKIGRLQMRLRAAKCHVRTLLRATGKVPHAASGHGIPKVIKRSRMRRQQSVVEQTGVNKLRPRLRQKASSRNVAVSSPSKDARDFCDQGRSSDATCSSPDLHVMSLQNCQMPQVSNDTAFSGNSQYRFGDPQSQENDHRSNVGATKQHGALAA